MPAIAANLTRRLLLASAIFGLLSHAPAAHAQSATRCGELAQLKIAAADIGLPTRGALITSTEMQSVVVDPKSPDGKREFCKVLGAIAPLDSNAPPIHFQVNLPLQWNGKAVQYGGGGWNGTLITGLAPLRDARADTPVAVARGFATWGTDAGHETAKLPAPAAFALNDEALANYAYASYKKTRDAARVVAITFYGRPPTKQYYYGGSAGGREGLKMAQLFPADFDGIVSIVPIAYWTGSMVARQPLVSQQRAGGWINPAKVAVIAKAVSAACDSMDGLADGVIGLYEKCLSLFDPATLRCPDGSDAGDHCLSDAQIEADRMVHRPALLPFALANGVTAFPGWNYGSELQAGGMVSTVTGPRPPRFPVGTASEQSIAWNFADGFIRYVLARDAKFDSLAFMASAHANRIREVSEILDATDPDLSAFHARGGKLIMKENGADYQKSPLQGISYYNSVVAKMGQPRVDQFVRFYVTPGVNHAGVGVTSSGADVPSKVDLLGVLDDWVDSGKAPDTLTQVSLEAKAPFTVIASRPMCRYPLYPRHNGQGDPAKADSFTCAAQ